MSVEKSCKIILMNLKRNMFPWETDKLMLHISLNPQIFDTKNFTKFKFLPHIGGGRKLADVATNHSKNANWQILSVLL